MGNLKKIVFGILAMLVMVTSVSATTSVSNILTDTDYCTETDENTIECKITTDIIIPDTISITGKNVTIDIADGKTLKLTGNTAHARGIIEVNSGSLTIKGGKVDATAVDTGSVKVVKVLGGTFVLDSTIETSETKKGNENAATVTVYGTDSEHPTVVKLTENSKITGYNTGFAISAPAVDNTIAYVDATLEGTIISKESAISTNGVLGKVQKSEANIKINGENAIFESTLGPAIYAAGEANWTIDGGSFTGLDALSIKSGTFVINGGYFHANGGYNWSPDPEPSAPELTGSAVSITSNNGYAGNVSLTINNGTFESKSGFAVYKYTRAEANDALTKIEIIDGNFIADNADVIALKMGSAGDKTKTDFIKGGVFTTTRKNQNVTMDKGFYDPAKAGTDTKGNVYIGEKAEALHEVTIVPDLKAFDGLGSSVINGFVFNTETDLTLVAGETYKLSELVFSELPAASKLAGYTITYKVSYTLDDVDYEDNYAVSYAKIATTSLLRRTFATDEMTMPAANIKIEVSIAKTAEVVAESYKVTVEDPENVTVDKEEATLGEIVQVTVNPKTGYESKLVVSYEDAEGNTIELAVTKNEDGTYSFSMPAADVKVSVEYTEKTPEKTPENNPEAGGQETESGKGDENNNNTGSTNENQNTTDNKTDEIIDENSGTLDSIVSIVTLAISSLGTAGYSIKKFIRK